VYDAIFTAGTAGMDAENIHLNPKMQTVSHMLRYTADILN
jgi:hypothetical protein